MIVKAIAEKMVDMKENMGSFQNGNTVCILLTVCSFT